MFEADLNVIRMLASVPPGPAPVALNAVKVAESIRPERVVVEGGGDAPVVMPRTACQIVYPDGAVMIDSGLDQETHDSFGTGPGEPYFPDRFALLRKALDAAKAIVLTHYHADHVGGVIRAPNFPALARKTFVTFATADLLVNQPHRPDLRLSPEEAGLFVLFDYRTCHPLSPGVVLIKAPGHSPDMQMVYIRLASGKEFLHCIDAAWRMDNILRLKGKAAPWVKEDAGEVLAQLRWLKALHESEPDVTILITHDADVLEAVTRSGLVGADLVV